MEKYIVNFCKSRNLGYSVHKGNYYITKGDAELYPCVIAHTDTVHRIIDNFKILNYRGIYYGMDIDTMEQAGTGGDDKCGVYLALRLLDKYENIKIVFFRDEEAGCIGSGLANMDYFKDCAFILQADRKGREDVIRNDGWTDLYSKAFSKHIAPILDKHDRTETTGLLTDVITLVEQEVGICCTNLSCGYYRPHTDSEVVSISDVEETFHFMSDIIDACSHKQWKHKPAKDNKRAGLWNTGGLSWAGNGASQYTGSEYYDICDTCGTSLFTDEEQEAGLCYECARSVYGLTLFPTPNTKRGLLSE